jgi:hypothetical protein
MISPRNVVKTAPLSKAKLKRLQKWLEKRAPVEIATDSHGRVYLIKQ